MKRWTWLCVILGMFSVGQVYAGGAGLTLKAGTLGLGGDLTVSIVSNLNLRAGYNAATLSKDVDLDEAECEGELDWQTIPILLDWHPARGGFRVSAGAVINNNEILLSAEPTVDYEINGHPYTILGLDGRITFDSMGWYAGIGYGNAAGEGRVNFACDFGVMYHGKPVVEAYATAANSDIQNILNADLQREVEDVQEDIKGFVIYPVISVGISFTF